jgi:integrase/recombinase XerD
VLSANEAQRILTRPDTQTLYGIRDRAILETLYATGVRRSELVILKLLDFDYEGETLRVYAPKTRSERIIPTGKRAAQWIRSYIDRVRTVLDRGHEALFLASHGGQLHVAMISQIVLQYMRMAGIKKQDAGHIFRRTCATLLLENGADIRSVQEILGHGKTTSTQVYTKISIRKLREVHKRTHPAERDPLEKIDKIQKQPEKQIENDAKPREQAPGIHPAAASDGLDSLGSSDRAREIS